MLYNINMEDLKKVIGNNIAVLRKSYGLTQVEFAEKLNYSDKSVSKWERGESIPDVYVLKQIAVFFNVTVDSLLTQYKNEKNLLGKSKKYKQRNRLIISLISAGGCWVIATLVFILLSWCTSSIARPWLIFVWCLDISTLVLFIFSCIWGKKLYNYILLSVLLWSVIASIFITIDFQNKWLIFMLGIPIQVVILLSFFIFNKRDSKKGKENNIEGEVKNDIG